MALRASILIAFGAVLSGCAATVDYGKVPHAAYVADPRCGAEPPGQTSVDPAALFIATSRLPDCRAPELALTLFRSERMHFGRFSEPQAVKDAKGKAHTVLPLTLQGEGGWWADLAAAAAKSDGRVLLYVHGFRETPTSSSRAAAQIARLTGFHGPVVEYSWPSQGKLLSYAVDETNMYWDERNFRKFLQRLAQQSWTREIVLVSHSLGARLVLPAVEYVDLSSSSADSSNISNIILAAPDVDREDFERDIAEEVLSARRVNNDRRITVYVSSRDKALALSRGIHGYPRLGSPYCFDPFEAATLKARGLPPRCYAAKFKYDVPPAKSGLTIVDTSDVSRSSTGHSDFLQSAAACADFAAVAGGNQNPPGRTDTSVAHVFALKPAGKVAGKVLKAADKAVCKLAD